MFDCYLSACYLRLCLSFSLARAVLVLISYVCTYCLVFDCHVSELCVVLCLIGYVSTPCLELRLIGYFCALCVVFCFIVT